MNDTLKIVQTDAGLSDTVWLAVITALVTVATLIIKGIIEAQARKAERVAASEAAKVTERIAEVEIKIDGRLTELLRISKLEAEERGHRMGKEQEKQEEKDRKQENPPTPTTSTALPDAGPVKLNITEGVIRVVPETEKKKK